MRPWLTGGCCAKRKEIREKYTLLIKYEGKVVPVYAIKADWESGVIAPFNLQFCTRWSDQP
jgi:hypothetical protein